MNMFTHKFKYVTSICLLALTFLMSGVNAYASVLSSNGHIESSMISMSGMEQSKHMTHCTSMKQAHQNIMLTSVDSESDSNNCCDQQLMDNHCAEQMNCECSDGLCGGGLGTVTSNLTTLTVQHFQHENEKPEPSMILQGYSLSLYRPPIV